MFDLIIRNGNIIDGMLKQDPFDTAMDLVADSENKVHGCFPTPVP